jgi:hypothetical protein
VRRRTSSPRSKHGQPWVSAPDNGKDWLGMTSKTVHSTSVPTRNRRMLVIATFLTSYQEARRSRVVRASASLCCRPTGARNWGLNRNDDSVRLARSSAPMGLWQRQKLIASCSGIFATGVARSHRRARSGSVSSCQFLGIGASRRRSSGCSKQSQPWQNSGSRASERDGEISKTKHSRSLLRRNRRSMGTVAQKWLPFASSLGPNSGPRLCAMVVTSCVSVTLPYHCELARPSQFPRCWAMRLGDGRRYAEAVASARVRGTVIDRWCSRQE